MEQYQAEKGGMELWHPRTGRNLWLRSRGLSCQFSIEQTAGTAAGKAAGQAQAGAER